MNEYHFTLSSRGLVHASTVPLENDFTFIVGSKSYQCNRIFACFISPIVTRILRTDPNVNSYKLNINDPTNLFNDVMHLMIGAEVNITQKNYLFIKNVGRLLGNNELIECAHKIDDEELTVENCTTIINSKYRLELPISKEITYIAKNLSDISVGSLKSLQPEILYNILIDKSLTIDNEGWLLSFIIDMIKEKGNDYTCLLSAISVEFLTKEDLVKYFEYFRLEYINDLVWSSMQRRMINSTTILSAGLTTRYTRPVIHFPFKEPLNGILNYLTKNRNSTNYPFTIKASDYQSQAKRVIDRKKESRWQSNREPNSYLLFDFNEFSIKPNGYTIRTYKCPAGPEGYHMKSWKLSGSVDGVNWIDLDVQRENSQLNGPYNMTTLMFYTDKWVRFLKLEMIDKNHAGNDCMTVGDIEFYGDLK
ncbi:hypothetical protein TRFO_03464 [Tritrichomonas foetus]|uniref:F5/8 type C domain-containing protein n=1 Tax=Tritrichomonas foetus TaxID=1144522 RepID=A0A1J4KU74_9EUKA|nr:hypothetical protein TRFO_03464 [Tritrichomonas foetus]|eukprot:OHT13045.1 hypothetical protein TRFO_03464 [Tritrichomonas foetus]